MSKSRLASALVLGTLLAATTLAGLPGVAHAQATDASTGKQAARRPPTQTQSGRPGTSTQPRPTSGPSQVTRGDRPPKARSASPGIPGCTRRPLPPSRTANPGGRSRRWPC
jgi:hypothetical protein